jgi:hypothetical protein
MNFSRLSYGSFLFLLFTAICFANVATAQMARKPSPSREPAEAVDKKPDSPKNALVKIDSQADFDLPSGHTLRAAARDVRYRPAGRE